MKKGSKHTAAASAKMSAARIGKKQTAETRARISEALHGRPHAPEHTAKSAAGYSRERRSANTKRWWAAHPDSPRRYQLADTYRLRYAAMTPEEQDAAVGKMMVGRTRLTSLEKRVVKWLDALGVDYAPHVIIGRYQVDLLVESRHLVIECDGELWHNTERARTHDKKRDEYFHRIGYVTVRLGERDILSGAARRFIEWLFSLHKEPAMR